MRARRRLARHARCKPGRRTDRAERRPRLADGSAVGRSPRRSVAAPASPRSPARRASRCRWASRTGCRSGLSLMGPRYSEGAADRTRVRVRTGVARARTPPKYLATSRPRTGRSARCALTICASSGPPADCAGDPRRRHSADRRGVGIGGRERPPRIRGDPRRPRPAPRRDRWAVLDPRSDRRDRIRPAA